MPLSGGIPESVKYIEFLTAFFVFHPKEQICGFEKAGRALQYKFFR
jgi:hypothetical protein